MLPLKSYPFLFGALIRYKNRIIHYQMENQIIDISYKIYTKTQLALRFGFTLMIWFGMISFFTEQLTTKPVMAHHNETTISTLKNA